MHPFTLLLLQPRVIVSLNSLTRLDWAKNRMVGQISMSAPCAGHFTNLHQNILTNLLPIKTKIHKQQ